jgi:hypothetical protein
VLICTVLPAYAGTTSRSSSRVTFGIEPASARGADGRPNFSFGVTPGAVLHDHVAVLNYSSIPLSLQLYATDAVETSGGGFGLLPATTRPVGAGSWIRLPRRFSTVRVPAQSATGPGQIVVPFVVKVPDKAAPGDHVGGVVASLRSVGTANSQRVILVQRIGTRVFILVSGKLVPRLTLTGVSTTYDGTLNPVGQGKVKVSYLVSNTGNVDLSLNQSISASGLFGDKRQIALPAIGLLIPGGSVHESVVIPGVWPQFLVHSTVSARPSAVAVAVSRVPSLAPVKSTSSVWAIPWAQLGILLLLILAAGYLVYRSRARSRARARAAARPRAAERQVVNA